MGCYSPPPLRKSRPEIRENTGPGLILGQDQGRHRVVKQTERKLCVIDYDLLTMLSLEYKTTVICGSYEYILDLKVFSSGCSQHAFPQIDFWRTLTVLSQNGCKSPFSGKEGTLGSELASSLLFPMWLLLLSDCSIAPY